MTTDTAAAASIEAAARELKLPVVRTDVGRVAADAKRSKLSYLGFLAELLEAESTLGPNVDAHAASPKHASHASNGSPTSTLMQPPPSNPP